MPTTASLYATSVVGVTQTWANQNNAAGSTTGTNATWTSATSAAVATMTLAFANAKAAVPDQPASFNSITVQLFHNTSTESTAHTVRVQLFYGGVAIGSSQAVTVTTTKAVQSVPLSGVNLPMYSQLDLLRVVVTITKASNTGQRTYTLDTVAVVINWNSKADTSEYTTFEPAVAPVGVSVVGTGAGGVLGHEFFVTAACWARGIRFFRPSTSVTGTIRGRIYTVRTSTTGDPLIGTDVQLTLSTTPASGWFEMRFATPVRLQPNLEYRVAVYFPSGRPDVASFWSTGGGAAGLISGPCAMPAASAAIGGMQEQFNVVSGQGTAGLVYPNTSNSQSGNACIDVIVSTTATTDLGPQPVREPVGTAFTTSSSATSLSVTVPPGNTGLDSLIVVVLAGWGYPSATDQGNVNISDTKGNQYFVDFSRISSSDGISKIWSCINRQALVSGNQITCTFPANSHNLVMTVMEFNGVTFSNLAAGDWLYSATLGDTGTSTTPGAQMQHHARAPVEALVLATLFLPAASTEGFTQDPDTNGGAPWVEESAVFSDAASRQQAVRVSYKVPAETARPFAWDPTLGQSRTWIEQITTYRGSPDRPATPPSGLMPTFI